jgi:hypothetical protein
VIFVSGLHGQAPVEWYQRFSSAKNSRFHSANADTECSGNFRIRHFANDIEQQCASIAARGTRHVPDQEQREAEDIRIVAFVQIVEAVHAVYSDTRRVGKGYLSISGRVIAWIRVA